jgi:hypothetical protein
MSRQHGGNIIKGLGLIRGEGQRRHGRTLTPKMPPFHGKNTASEKLTKIHGKCFSNFWVFLFILARHVQHQSARRKSLSGYGSENPAIINWYGKTPHVHGR